MLGLDKGFTIYDPRDTGAVKPAYGHIIAIPIARLMMAYVNIKLYLLFPPTRDRSECA
jgi:hypothetical protein